MHAEELSAVRWMIDNGSGDGRVGVLKFYGYWNNPFSDH